MRLYSSLLRPLLFRFDAEWAHDRAIHAGRIVGRAGLAKSVLSALYRFEDPRLETDVSGIAFRNPIGLAAGYDKNGWAVEAMTALGFGFTEIGSISADPSEGNPRPRLFRLPRDRAIVVHYGLPNDGAAAIAGRLAGERFSIPLGINIVKTNRGIDAPPDSDDAIIDDYVRSVRALKDRGAYLCLNLSCPNTEMGRDFFADHGNVTRLLAALDEVDISCPVFLKISPLGGIPAIEGLLEAVDGADLVSGFIFNLPPGKPDGLRTPRWVVDPMPGAVSGKPVEALMDECIRQLFRRMNRRRYRIIGAGGVSSAEDAYRKICLGASLVELMTALVYEGPGLIKRIKRGLAGLLERDGFASVAEAVGTADE